MKPKVYATAADNGACGHYRILDPLNALATHDYSVGFNEGTFVNEEEQDDYVKQSNVFVFQRPRTMNQRVFFEEFSNDPDKLLVFEHDDNTWDLHPLSDHFRWHGTTDIAIPIQQYIDMGGNLMEARKNGKTVKDGMVWLWEHGRNGYNVIENQEKKNNFERCLALADVVTCTTPRLGKLFKQKAKAMGNKKVKVYDLPNCLDMRRWMPVDINHDDVRILWQGGASHQPDLKVIQEALEVICKKYPQVTIIMGGVSFPGITKNINPKQVEVYDNWTEFSAHPYRMALYAADINLVPIEDMYFNGFKSDIKVTEAGALSIPSVASDLPPYNESIKNNKTGLLVPNTTDAWVEALSRLVESEKLRKTIGAAARKFVEKERNVHTAAPQWGKVYEKELKRKKASKPSLTQTSSPPSKKGSTTPRVRDIPPTSSLGNSSSLRQS